ncbi:hypothetical protein CR513_52946, partial [Mucuna pruriens]
MKRQEEAEKCHEEELKRAEEREARLKEQLESLQGPMRALTSSLDPGLHHQWKRFTKLQAIPKHVEGGGDEIVLRPSTTLHNITFESQFAANKTKRLEVADLFDIKQTKTEILKQYLTRFNDAMVRVNDPYQKFFAGPFSDLLALSRPVSMTEIKAWAKKHVEAEEDRLLVEKELLTMGKKTTLGHYGLGGAGHSEAQVKKYTSLKATRAQILKEVYHLHLLDMPPPTKRQLGSLREERCKFHRTWDHMKEDCRVLKSQIEKLIQESYLEYFVKRSENERPKTRELPERDKNAIVICVMINPKTCERQLVEIVWDI